MSKHLTWDEWKAKGFHVVAGERSKRRNADGKATFSRKQVRAISNERSYHYPDKTYGFDWDSDDREFYGLGHDDW